MPRYIDADDFDKRLSNPPYTIYDGEMFEEWFDECFDTQPTVDAELVRHGRWIVSGCWDESRGMDENYGNYFKCSICGEEVKGGYKQCGDKYCRNCGAKMDGGEEDAID